MKSSPASATSFKRCVKDKVCLEQRFQPGVRLPPGVREDILGVRKIKKYTKQAQ